MPAYSYVTASADAASATSAGTVAGTSAPLTVGRTYFIVAVSVCRCATSAVIQGNSFFRLGTTVFSRCRTMRSAGGPAGTLGGFQQSCFILHTPAAADTMNWLVGSNDAVTAGAAASMRAIAIDVTDQSRRFHSQSANTDAVVTTPGAASGWVPLGAVGSGRLSFVAPVSGRYWIFASCESAGASAGAVTDEIALRTVINGTPIIASQSFKQVTTATRSAEGVGYSFVFPVDVLAGATVTVDIEGNGTLAGGTVGYRRIRTHALHESLFSEIQYDGDTTGFTRPAVAGTFTLPPQVTLAPSGTHDYVVLWNYQHAVNFWDRTFQLTNGAGPAPPNGHNFAVEDTGLGAADDMPLVLGMNFMPGRNAADVLELQGEMFVGTFGANDYGSNCVRAGAGAQMQLLAIRLEFPDASRLLSSLCCAGNSGPLETVSGREVPCVN